MPDRVVAIVVFDGMQSLDLTGPTEVFAGANRHLRSHTPPRAGYQCRFVGVDPGAVATDSGLQIVADTAPDDLREIDTLVIPGGDGAHDPAAELVALVEDLAPRARRIATVCTGAFIAAAAGLLDRRRCATHWARTDRLQRRHPDIEVDADAIYVRDGHVWSSAGVTAGIDLALALVEDDHGTDVAQVTARWLVMYLRRPGGQSQFATPVWTEAAEREPIRAAQDLAHADPAADLSIARLAAHAGMSERNFTRAFRREVGTTPGRYVEALRVDVARGFLETSTSSLDVVASAAGFGTAETLRRSFHRVVGVTPGAYRERFSTRPPATEASS